MVVAAAAATLQPVRQQQNFIARTGTPSPSRLVIVVCDCVYPGQSSLHLAWTLKDLLRRNPKAHVLLGYERRSFSGLPPGTDFYAEFFTGMRAECRVDPVPEEELDPEYNCVMRLQSDLGRHQHIVL